MKSIGKTLKGITDYHGRSTRMELWIFILFIVVVTIAIGLASFVAFTTGHSTLGVLIVFAMMSFNMITAISLVPLGVRRLHDIGFNGFFLILAFVPVIGIPALLVLSLFDSKPGKNKYGPNPKGIGNLVEETAYQEVK